MTQLRPLKNAVWAEFMPYSWVRADLPRLAAAGLQLNLAIQMAHWNSPALQSLLHAAEAEGVPVGAWLLLDDAQGYWPNAENAEIFCQHVQQFVDWLAGQQLQVHEIIVDMETPLALSRLLKGRLLQGLQLEYRRWRSPRTHHRFWQSVECFQELVHGLHAQGLRVQVVSYPMIVHDALAGDTALQEFLQIPVTPVNWDEISLMVYRSSFQDFLPFRISSGMVYRYLESARRALDTPISAALGVVGTLGKLSESGFSNPDEIAADIRAAQAAQALRIQLFSLDGMHQLGAPQDWLRLLTTTKKAQARALESALPEQDGSWAAKTSYSAPPLIHGDRLLWQSLSRSHRLLAQGHRWLSPS